MCLKVLHADIDAHRMYHRISRREANPVLDCRVPASVLRHLKPPANTHLVPQ